MFMCHTHAIKREWGVGLDSRSNTSSSFTFNKTLAVQIVKSLLLILSSVIMRSDFNTHKSEQRQLTVNEQWLILVLLKQHYVILLIPNNIQLEDLTIGCSGKENDHFQEQIPAISNGKWWE